MGALWEHAGMVTPRAPGSLEQAGQGPQSLLTSPWDLFLLRRYRAAVDVRSPGAAEPAPGIGVTSLLFCSFQDLKEKKEVVEETENGRDAPANGNANEENGEQEADNEVDEEEEEGGEEEDEEEEGEEEDGDEDDEAEGERREGKRAAEVRRTTTSIPRSRKPMKMTRQQIIIIFFFK
ncbi:PREDICTED: prothymosin alpha [Aptenodytes forsteri]|uniref:prothymosin alpha n=1 Tax=Aptenodytes forsteri TaxID=9233 RepID=UPI0004F4A77C|nr:PREDICTED: prothymosin alpha [Aptenodytes forsteri]